MTYRFVTAAFAVSLAGLLATLPASALEWERHPDFQTDIVQKATRAFRGTVVDISNRSARLSSRRAELPYTRVRFRVEHAYKGVSVGQIVALYVPGGILARTGIEMAIPGIPSFRVGERAAVFLDDRNPFDRLFGTSFGDLGIRRIVDDREPYVLNGDWRAMRYDGSPLAVQCVPSSSLPAQCSSWIDNRRNPSVTETGEPTQMWVDIMVVEQLDQLVAEALASVPISVEDVRPVTEGPWRREFRAFFSALGRPTQN